MIAAGIFFVIRGGLVVHLFGSCSGTIMIGYGVQKHKSAIPGTLETESQIHIFFIRVIRLIKKSII